MYRLGGLTPSPRDAPHYAALFDQLRQLGFIEGQNLTIDWRGYGVRTEQFRDIAVELVKARPDVIFCAGDIAVRAVQQAQEGCCSLSWASSPRGLQSPTRRTGDRETWFRTCDRRWRCPWCA